MIRLTRLNGIPIVLNSDLIKTAEASPDTMLTLINGEKIIVRESCEDVSECVVAYRARLLAAVARRLPFATSYQELRQCSASMFLKSPARTQPCARSAKLPVDLFSSCCCT